MTVATAGAGGNGRWWCALFALCLVLLAPLTLTDVPPLVDYPNHLARLFTLAFIAHDPVLARFYAAHWGIIPNLGLDLTVPPLLRMFPVHLVGRVVIGVAVLLPVLGAAGYHRALAGKLSYWPLGAVLLAYNGSLLRGFLNFVLSVGLALLVAAVWIAWRQTRPVVAILSGMAGAIALFFCHLTGLLLFAILLGGHELASLAAVPFSIRWLTRRIAAAGLVFAAPAVLYLMSDLRRMPGEAVFRPLWDKGFAALTPVMNYVLPLDVATAALAVTVASVCLARRWCRMPPQAAIALTVALILFIGLPAGFKGGWDLDARFIVMAGFVACGGLVPIALPRRAAWVIGVGFLLLFGTRMTVLAMVWDAYDTRLTAFRSVIDTVRPGDVVLTARWPRDKDPDLWTAMTSARHLSDGTSIETHRPALLLIEHRAWWPFLFDNESQQPIRKREPYRSLAARIDNAANPMALLAHDAPPITRVLIENFPPGQAVPAPGMRLIAGNAEASLFAVTPSAISQSPPIEPPPGR